MGALLGIPTPSLYFIRKGLTRNAGGGVSRGEQRGRLLQGEATA